MLRRTQRNALRCCNFAPWMPEQMAKIGSIKGNRLAAVTGVGQLAAKVKAKRNIQNCMVSTLR